MIKKVLIMMFFVMCISTNPVAQAEPCYCGGPIDYGAYEICTVAFSAERDVCANNLQACHEAAVTEWGNCRAASTYPHYACNVAIGEAYKICDSYLRPCIDYGWATWWECTDSACI
jgi:hypothetical protein